jgi:hypothetical protein
VGELAVITRDEAGRYLPGKPPGPGRKSIYSQEIADTICDHIRNGTTIRYAALAAGITHETLYDWCRDKDDFSDAVARAQADCMARVSATVVKTATGEECAGDWRPAIEFLKRRDRAAWGDTLDLRQIPAETLLRLYQQQQEAITEDGAPALLPGDDLL